MLYYWGEWKRKESSAQDYPKHVFGVFSGGDLPQPPSIHQPVEVPGSTPAVVVG